MQAVPFGSWKSPITSELIVSGTIGLGGVTVDGEDIYWLEGRPSEGGRNVLVKRNPDGTCSDVTPPPFNLRTRVHEYGGGSYLMTQGILYFSNFADQRIYRQRVGEDPQPLTPENNHCRYADAVLDQKRDRLICVCENHSPGHGEPQNTLATIDLNTGTVETLISGSDFYSSPRLSPDGTQLTWLEWNHPNMPWDGTTLWLAPVLPNGQIGEKTCITGSDHESVCAPAFAPDGTLFFVSDRSNWWNLYCYTDQTIEPLFPLDAEFGYPHWVFGVQPYVFDSTHSLICIYSQNGQDTMARFEFKAKSLQIFNIPFTSVGSLQVKDNTLYFIGGSPTEPTQLVQMDIDSLQTQCLKRTSDLVLDVGYLSTPQEIEFPTEDGKTAYAWFYPPQNRDYKAPQGELPPLLVRSHGGPTAAANPTFNLRYQYWTSRGFALVDVNYGGSTGYGREYRQRLNGKWGIVDVADCVNAARYLVQEGKVDGQRLAIAGGSAGGYTTLAALTFHDVFKAGASYYGISDLEALAQDTHKFESRYLDGLIGKYPEEKEIYYQRSPIHFTEGLSCPVIFFQGLEDKVVPPNQAEMMVEALKKKGLPVAYVPFAEEQHGFRKAENIKRALDGEFYFYSRVFGYVPADNLEPISIFNL
ncbi:S9 family peptidase [Spirulina subsalsa]|uniref:S9 family peptidase n=1 Tax=Spirulina subsalsa TaxID=54311 RepID=UPI0002DCFAA0|nr:S9 family peptidase [Spirulina subsalsa]